jgi:hypothetical protein
MTARGAGASCEPFGSSVFGIVGDLAMRKE